MTYKAVIIGCGKIAGLLDAGPSRPPHGHANGYYQNPDIEVVCYVDTVEEKAWALASKYEGGDVERGFLNAIAKHKPDVVSICTPDETHFEITKDILQVEHPPRVIFLEKPACRTMAELKEMISLSKKRKTEILVNHTRRFDEKYKHLKQLISEDFFSPLIRGDIFYYSGWMHNGVHAIDTMGFVFDDELRIKEVFSKSDSPYPNDPTLDLVMDFENRPGTIYLRSFDERYYQLFEFDLKFEKGRLRIEDFGARIIYEKKVVNELNENVLVMDEISYPNGSSSPIQNAIDLLAEYLSAKDSHLLEGYRLADVAPTMKTLWEGVRLSRLRFKS